VTSLVAQTPSRNFEVIEDTNLSGSVSRREIPMVVKPHPGDPTNGLRRLNQEAGSMSREPRESQVSAVFRAVDQTREGPEKRRNPRYSYSIPVFVRVLIEEETFNPLRFPGRTTNISAGGMLVEIEGLSENDYRMLIHRQRMTRIHPQIPEGGGDAVFFGKIVWYDYRHTSRGTICNLGVAFDVLREKEQKVLDELLQRLESAAKTTPVLDIQE
jgi:hypothetical protein